MAATTPATEVSTAGSRMPICPEVTACEAALTSADTSPTRPRPPWRTSRSGPSRCGRARCPRARARRAPRRGPRAASPARAGVLTAEPAAVPTNVTTAVTHTMTPTTMPGVGLRWVRAAVRTTAMGTASTPTGCTTDSGRGSARSRAASTRPRRARARATTRACARPRGAPQRQRAGAPVGLGGWGRRFARTLAHGAVLQHGSTREAERGDHGEGDRRQRLDELGFGHTAPLSHACRVAQPARSTPAIRKSPGDAPITIRS